MIERLVIKEKYGVIPNSVLYDTKLSLRAKGLYAYLQAKPQGWAFSTERFEGPESPEVIKKTLNELIKAGYLARIQIYDQKHRFRGYLYILKSNPNDPVSDLVQAELKKIEVENPATENPSPEKPATENPTSEKPTPETRLNSLSDNETHGLYKNRDIKTEDIKKENNIDIESIKNELLLTEMHLNVNKRLGEMVRLGLGEFYEAIPPDVVDLLKELGWPRKNLTKYDRTQIFKLRDMAGDWENLKAYFRKCIELRPVFSFLNGFDWDTLIRKYDLIMTYEKAPKVDYGRFETPKAWAKFCVDNVPERWIRKLTFEWYFYWRFSDISMQDLETLVEKILKAKESIKRETAGV
jgi:hypothetical protein